MKKFFTFAENEEGLELAEYALAAALIGILVAAAFTSLGGSIVGALTRLAEILTIV
jgi:Flp pilus assembly pilin Flp